jgi:hypothetical protein
MSNTTNRLKLNYLLASQADKHVTMNDSLSRLDALVQCEVLSRSQTAQPTNPSDGQAFILPIGKSGPDWGGAPGGGIASYRDGSWIFYEPLSGLQVFVRDEGVLLVFKDQNWSLAAQPSDNLLINGAFQIWQRGTSFSNPVAGTYLADRWLATANAANVTRSSDLPFGTGFSLEFSGTNSAIAQRIEASACTVNVASKLYFRAWVKSVSSSASLVLGLRHANSANTFSSTTLIEEKSVSLSTGVWTRVEWNVTNLPPNAAHGLQIELKSQGANSGVRLGYAQAHLDGLPAAFPNRSLAIEQALCERYFEKSWHPDTSPGTFAINSGYGWGVAHPVGNLRARVPFRTIKLVTPAIKVYSASGNEGAITYYDGVWRSNGQLSVIPPNPSVSGFYCGHNIAGSVESQFGWTAEAEL